MGHRRISLVVVAASIFSICAVTTLPTLVPFVGNEAHAQNKGAKEAKGSGARTKPRAGANAGAKADGKGAPTAGASIPRIAVCVRPKDVDKETKEWTFSETYRPVVKDIEATAKRLGGRIYYFDEKASLDSPRLLPGPSRTLKCAKDDRKPEESSGGEEKAPGILGPAGPLFASARPLGRSSLASSGTGKTSTALVNQFVQTAADFNLSGNADETQATRFAERLSKSIQNTQAFPEFFSTDLSKEAASILVNQFGESIAAALADRSAIGPLQLMQKFAPSGKQSKWSILPLVANEMMDDKEILEPSEVPAVILSIADHQHRKAIVDAEVPWAMPVAALHGAYKKAYADKPQWIASIAVYFQ